MASPPTYRAGGGRSDSCEDDSASFSSSASDSYSPNFYQQPRHRRQRTTSCRSSGSQSGSRKNTIDKSLPKLCVICGDKAKGVNFNALTCMSCKAFFRRNALRNKEMKCPFQDRCSVDKITRKFCSKCRLKKCFDSGMKKEWILSEEEKLAIKEKIARNRARRQEESANGLPATAGSVAFSTDGNGRKRGRKCDNSQANATLPVQDYSCDILESLEFVGCIDQQLSNGDANSANNMSTASGLELFQAFQSVGANHDSGPIVSQQQQQQQNSVNRTSFLSHLHHHHHEHSRQSQQTPNNLQSAQQHHSQHTTQMNGSQSTSLFCLEPFDTLTISGNEPGFEWPTSGGQHSGDASIMDSLTNDLNDCCQILFPNDMFEIDVIKHSEFLEMDQPNSASDFSQYLLHGTDPNIQNGHCVPLLSCAQQFQQQQGSVPSNFVMNNNKNAEILNNNSNNQSKNRPPHVMSRLPINNGEDNDAELPDFLSACLGSNNVLACESEIRDPVIYDPKIQMALPADLEFLSGGLIQPEKELLAELSVAGKALDSPYRRMIDYDRCESLRSCRITEHTLLRLITMSKRVSIFGKLPIQDRVKLLKYNLLEMLGIRSVLMYIPEREAWSLINDDFKINILIKMNVIRPFCNRASWQRHKDFPSMFRSEWLRDTLIFDLLTVIVMFTPRGNLSDQSAVIDGQMRYSYLLRRYLETKYGCKSTSKEVYDRLMACVKEMRELNGDIINFFRGYHRLINGSPLFTQILELPLTSECIERHNEILSVLTDDSSPMTGSPSTSGYSSASTFDFTGNSVNNHNQVHQNGNLFAENAQANSNGVEVNVPQSSPLNIVQNGAQSVSASNVPGATQQNCFGILNSVN